MAVRNSEATWNGTLKEGNGTMKVGPGHYDGPFTYASRFETGEGTNPEELIGAAVAGCYSMYLSGVLSKNGFNPTRIHTTATVHLGAGPKINKIELDTDAEIPEIDDSQFQDFVKQAKQGCPVANALGGVDEIVVNAKLGS